LERLGAPLILKLNSDHSSSATARPLMAVIVTRFTDTAHVSLFVLRHVWLPSFFALQSISA
jgi:hypothetical protein